MLNIVEPGKCLAARLGIEIWIDIEKLESKQEPRLHISDTGLMSVVATRTVQGLIVNSRCLDPIIRNSVLSLLIFSLSWYIYFLKSLMHLSMAHTAFA